MVKTCGYAGAPARFITASGGTATVVTPRIPCGEDASGADSARRRQQVSRRKEADRRPPCTSQVVRAPDNQHQPLSGACDDAEQSIRRSGERTPRRLDRHPRRAQCARWCRLPDQCRPGTRRVGLQYDHFWCHPWRTADERRRCGIDAVPRVAAEA
jgi:hypothetical protein